MDKNENVINISSRLTIINRYVWIVLSILFLVGSILSEVYLQMGGAFFVFPLISILMLVLRALPAKIIMLQDNKLIVQKGGKGEYLKIDELVKVDSLGAIGLYYEIETKTKRKHFDRLIFIPSYMSKFSNFGIGKTKDIKRLEELINNNDK